MICELKVNGLTRAERIAPIAPIFSWQCDNEMQFTIQMSATPDFRHIMLLRDTHNRYITYDGFPLKKGRTYYWRVRSGLDAWAQGSFATSET